MLTHDINDDNIKEIFYRLTHEMNIKNDIKLKLCKYISTPLGIGIIKPYILLPKITYNNHEIEWILRHELMHYKKYDLVYKSLLMITVSIHWFNPFVYIMRKYINYECELSCDESILKNFNIKEKKFYANILINSIQINKNDVLKSNLSTGLQLNNNKTILKRRLITMLNSKTKKRGLITLAIATVIVSSSFLSFKSYAHNVNKALPSKINSSTTESTINNSTTKPKVNSDAKVLYEYTTQVNGEFIPNKK